jgi:hypothetical protein
MSRGTQTTMEEIQQIIQCPFELMGRKSELWDNDEYSYKHAAFPNINIKESGNYNYDVSVTGDTNYNYRCKCRSEDVYYGSKFYVFLLGNIHNEYPDKCEGSLYIPFDSSQHITTTIQIYLKLRGRGIGYCMFLVLKLYMDSLDVTKNLTNRQICLDYFNQIMWNDQYYYVLMQLLKMKGCENETPRMKDVLKKYDYNIKRDQEEILVKEFTSSEFNKNLLKAVENSLSAKIIKRLFGFYNIESIMMVIEKGEESIDSVVRQSEPAAPFHVYHTELENTYFCWVEYNVYNVYDKDTHVLENIIHFEKEDRFVTCTVLNSSSSKILIMEFKSYGTEPILTCNFPFDSERINKLCHLVYVILKGYSKTHNWTLL